MKKQLLIAVVLVATLSKLNAHIFGEGGLVDNALNVPGDVLYGDDYYNGYYRDGGYRDDWRGGDYDRGYDHRGLFGRRHYRD